MIYEFKNSNRLIQFIKRSTDLSDLANNMAIQTLSN